MRIEADRGSETHVMSVSMVQTAFSIMGLMLVGPGLNMPP